MVGASAFFAAQNIYWDPNTGAFSIGNVLDNIQLSSFPASIPAFKIFGILERENGDNAAITLSLESFFSFEGADITIPISVSQMDVPLDFNEQLRIFLPIECVIPTLTGPGVLDMRLNYGSRMLASYTLSVKKSMDS
jgi:hypothetical protein